MRTLDTSELKSISGGYNDLCCGLGVITGASFLYVAAMTTALYFFPPNQATHDARIAEVALIKANFADLMGTLSTAHQGVINAYIAHREHVADITGFVNGMGTCR